MKIATIARRADQRRTDDEFIYSFVPNRAIDDCQKEWNGYVFGLNRLLCESFCRYIWCSGRKRHCQLLFTTNDNHTHHNAMPSNACIWIVPIFPFEFEMKYEWAKELKPMMWQNRVDRCPFCAAEDTMPNAQCHRIQIAKQILLFSEWQLSVRTFAFPYFSGKILANIVVHLDADASVGWQVLLI